MGRKSKIAEIQARLGKPLDKFILENAKEGKEPAEIASLLGVSFPSTYYSIVKTFDLKDKLKEIYGAKSRPQGHLAETTEQFITGRRVAGMSPRTITTYEEFFRRFFKFLDERSIRADLDSFNYINVQNYFDYLKTEVRTNAPLVKQSTLLHYWNIFQAFGNWLVKMEIIDKNPMKKVLKPKQVIRVAEDMPDDEIVTLLNSFENNFTGIRNKTIVTLFLDTGMRIGGMAGLRVDSIDTETGWGTVLEKGNKERNIKLSKEALNQLHIYLQAREGIESKAKSLWIETNGNALAYRAIEGVMERLNRSGIIKTHIHAHLFRHVWAKHMVLSKVSAMALMKMAGWEDLSLAQHYAAAYSVKDAWEEQEGASPITKLKGAK